MLRYTPLALAGLLVATAAIAQTPPPPRAPDAPTAQNAVPPRPPGGPEADAPPPPPPGPRGPRGDRPPPPRGASVHLDKGQDGAMRLDIHCAERDSTKECADIAMQVLDRITNNPKDK